MGFRYLPVPTLSYRGASTRAGTADSDRWGERPGGGAEGRVGCAVAHAAHVVRSGLLEMLAARRARCEIAAVFAAALHEDTTYVARSLYQLARETCIDGIDDPA